MKYKITFTCPHCPDNKCGCELESVGEFIVYGYSKKDALKAFKRQKGCRYMKAQDITELR